MKKQNGWKIKKLTYQNFPVFHCLCDCVCTSHFTVGEASDDKNDEARAAFVASFTLLLVPLTIASTVCRSSNSS